MKIQGSISFKVAALTDVGIKRKGGPNQDAVGIVLPRLFQPRPPFLILADGMGGYAGGSQASQLVVQAFKKIYLKYNHASNAIPVLEEAVHQAHVDIHDFSKQHTGYESMGSTVVAVVLHPDHADLINVGDSRAYLIRGGQLIQISKDQSLVAELVRRGALTPEQAQVSPSRNQLSMALSANRATVEPYSTSIAMQKGDGVLLCSDGLWGSVAEVLIQSVASQMPPETAGAKLIELANKAGGVDNISVVIAMPEDVVKRMQTTRIPGGSDKTDPGLGDS